MGKRNNKFYENTCYVMTGNDKFNHLDYQGLFSVINNPSSLEELATALIGYCTGDGEHVIIQNYRHVANFIFNHDLQCHHYAMHFLDEMFSNSKNMRTRYGYQDRKEYFIKINGKEYEIEVAYTKTTFIITINADIDLKNVSEHFTI